MADAVRAGKTLHIGLVDHDPDAPERFFCASESAAVVPIPSLTTSAGSTPASRNGSSTRPPVLCRRPQGGDWVEQFGFLRDSDPSANGGLPIGFVVSRYRPQSGAPSPVAFVGFSCALCHSTLIRAGGDQRGQILYGPGSSSLNLFAACRNPGKCLAEHVGVNAPGNPKIAMRFFAAISSTLNAFGPMVQPGVSSSMSSHRVPPGSLSPTLIAI